MQAIVHAAYAIGQFVARSVIFSTLLLDAMRALRHAGELSVINLLTYLFG